MTSNLDHLLSLVVKTVIIFRRRYNSNNTNMSYLKSSETIISIQLLLDKTVFGVGEELQTSKNFQFIAFLYLFMSMFLIIYPIYLLPHYFFVATSNISSSLVFTCGECRIMRGLPMYSPMTSDPYWNLSVNFCGYPDS